jgi:hypothetical protein
MDRWVYSLTGSPEETLTRKSADNFLTDKMDLNSWNRDQVSSKKVLSQLMNQRPDELQERWISIQGTE